ncbi:type IV toxin-antitoxin system AbiEi family antitoxin domain-containing protein [Geobacter sp.]|uniref:type IV toxin-antitoxin system AbiEi family antitoxin n=1 Tax=Geobacter sp. TaxID=46610 RepID=UPI002634FA6D|nr:type IV toxin-antitoxin system AbiEi family antitoxin domain-containing protein [Geobacter sp.]
MQPVKQLMHILAQLADDEHYLFSLSDLQGALPGQSQGAFRALVSRAEKEGLLTRVCRGLYLYPRVNFPRGLILYHVAARLRASEFNYISLETALSDAGVISQVPMNWITLMSSGRSHIVNCGDFGRIEFVHTKKRPETLADQLVYDPRCHLWRASVALAIRDMRATGRSTDLVDWGAVDELV